MVKSARKGGKMYELLFSLIVALSPQQEAKIKENGFVIIPTTQKSIYEIYESAKKRNIPILVTSDVVLHTTHILFDYLLRIQELERLFPDIKELTKGMFEKSLKDYEKMKCAPSLINSAFFGVGYRLLMPNDKFQIPKEISAKINAEISLIERHDGIHPSPIFGYLEDYTQYIPRGHYTRTVQFKKYFKAMMWYGRLGFYLKPSQGLYPTKIDPIKEGIKLTRSAMLITYILKKNPELLTLWNGIYKPTTFFVGKADDYTIEDYIPLIHGEGRGLINQTLTCDDSTVLDFIKEAGKLEKPRILSSVIFDTLDTESLRAFRFMGQRFIPDSYIMGRLVYPYVKRYRGEGKPFTCELLPIVGLARAFPRGLDVMSALGSDKAGEILKESKDTDYEKYDEQIAKMQKYISELDDAFWSENLYTRWLYALKCLVTMDKTRFPEFMRKKLFSLKELNCALGSWAELRHDTILYAKQSYTMALTSVRPSPHITRGYVEPYIEVYFVLKGLIKSAREQFEFPESVENKLKKFEEILCSFEEISEKELQGKRLTEDEYRLIWNIGSTLESITRFSPEIMKKITTGTDENMAIIADVHTDPNSGQVLEEAVGYPSIIYADTPSGIAKGAIFSYYEFKSPMSKRLTDEEWQKRLKESSPDLEKWFLPLVSN